MYIVVHASVTPKMPPKCDQIHVKLYKTPPNDGFDLKFGIGMISGTRKPMVMLEFQIS